MTYGGLGASQFAGPQCAESPLPQKRGIQPVEVVDHRPAAAARLHTHFPVFQALRGVAGVDVVGPELGHAQGHHLEAVEREGDVAQVAILQVLGRLERAAGDVGVGGGREPVEPVDRDEASAVVRRPQGLR